MFRSGSRSNHLLGYSNFVVDASEGPESVTAAFQVKLWFIPSHSEANCLKRKLQNRWKDVGSVLRDHKCLRDSIMSQVVFRVATNRNATGMYVDAFQRVKKCPLR